MKKPSAPSVVRKQRKGDLFMVGLDVIFLIAIILIFWKLGAAFSQTNTGEGLGTRQTAMLNTYAVSEQMLLYIDETAKFAAYEALAKIGEKGLSHDAAEAPCGTYAGYTFWSFGDQPCFPPTDPGNHDAAAERLKKELDANLLHSIAYPGMPSVITYTYSQISTRGGITIYGKTDDRIVVPIVTAKGGAQSSITPLLERDNLIRNQQGMFNPDPGIGNIEVLLSPNKRDRAEAAKYVIIHVTQTKTFTDAAAQYTTGTTASVHYLIDTDGSITQLVPESQVAFHMPGCDSSKQCSIGGILPQADIEQQSIGIALVNAGLSPDRSCADDKEHYAQLKRTSWCGKDSYKDVSGATCTGDEFKQRCWANYPAAQLSALQSLLSDIVARRDIDPRHILLEEQVSYASSNPGPALTGRDSSGKLLPQAQWWNDFRAAAVADAQKIKAAAQSVAQPSDRPRDSSSPAPQSSDALLSVAWPTDATIITSCFGQRKRAGGEFHYGIDIGARTGDPIRAVADGTVVDITAWSSSCKREDAGKKAGCSSWGNGVVIKHSDTFYTRYNHLESVSVKRAAVVHKGDVIGAAGNTGISDAPHLDLTIYKGDPSNHDNAIDPFCIMPDTVLGGLRFGASSNCAAVGFSANAPAHADAYLAAECRAQKVDAHTSVPACNINTQAASAGGSDTLTTTLRNIDSVSGLHDTINKAAQDQGIDPRLLIAIMTQESQGKTDAVSYTGCVGLGQICGGSAPKEVYDPRTLKRCKCPSGRSCSAKEAGCADDPRTEPQSNAKAMAIITKSKLSHFEGKNGQVLFTLAAYNGGEGTILAAIKRTGNPDPAWTDVAGKIDASLIQQVYCARAESAECRSVGTPELQARKAREIVDYVTKVGGYYTAMGGTVDSAFTDQTCDGMDVKELGTYSFSPSFTVQLPDLLALFDDTAQFSKDAYAACSAVDDPRACLQQKISGFSKDGLRPVQCDGANESLVENLAEAIDDCWYNLQQGCVCYWEAPKTFTGKNLTIDIYGNYGFKMTADGQPLVVRPPASNAPADDPGGLYRDTIAATPWNASRIRYSFLYTDGKLSGKRVEAGSSVSHALTPDNYLPLYNDGNDLSWVADPTGAPACGLYKTTQRICVSTAQPVYVLSKSAAISPTIRFALDLYDAKNPDAVTGLAIVSPQIPELTGVPQADNVMIAELTPRMLGEKSLDVTFTASNSPDVSYYQVRCTAANNEFPEKFSYAYGRKDANVGTQYAGTIGVTLDDCGGAIKPGQCVLPGVPPTTMSPTINKAGCYKVQVTPVDLAGNQGDSVVYDQSEAAAPGEYHPITNAAVQPAPLPPLPATTAS